MSDLVTIIMPARNAGPFLVESLNSILNQSYTNWELIVINDHSTDNTEKLLDTYSKKDSRIRYFNAEGRGIIDALQQGYQFTRGNFITRMDADDIMTTDKIELLLNAIISSPMPAVSVGGVKYFSEDHLGDGYKKYELWLNRLTYSETNYNDIYRECVIPSPCWMTRRDTLDGIGGFNSNIYPEDYDLCFRFYKHQIKIAGIQKILHHWRDYPSRSSRTDPNYADNRFLELKMKYFMELDFDESHPLILWGSGTKGKWIAQHLLGSNIDFTWITDNSNKIGLHIYDQLIQGPHSINKHDYYQAIVSVSARGARREIEPFLVSWNCKAYWFA